MEAPEPVLPDTNLWPTILWFSVLVVVLAASLFHAGARKRWGWMIGMVVIPPLGVVSYWAVELVRQSLATQSRTPVGSNGPISN